MLNLNRAFIIVSPLISFLTADVGSAAEPTPKNPIAVQESGASDKVLRHAVFFKFKDSSTKDQVNDVVEAFRALPAKIDGIKGFEHGTNISREEFDDGFTHCFLLSFADDAGRAAYLPHPEHKAFGNVLRPHLDKVFVIDYWGNPRASDERELRHAVFFKFKDGTSEADVRKVEEAFEALAAKIEAVKAFEWGKNNSPEKHDAGFTHAFLVTFESEAGREEYREHPEHEGFVKMAHAHDRESARDGFLVA